MLITVFLSVLVLALALGNLFLSITEPKGLQSRAKQENNSSLQIQQETALPATGDDFQRMADRERVRMLNKRIDRLENLLLRINNARFVAKKLNGTNLIQKLNGFEEFKQNTRLEIAALKQQLASMQKNKPKATRKAVPETDDEKLHKLVYHSAR